MRLLLTNDDGIDAPGIQALEQALREIGECVVLAPDEHLSGCSHQATTMRPLTLSQQDGNRYSLDGTPVDCTRVGLSHLVPECRWVISGINAGGNLGADVYHSGTVAAAREGALMGRCGIAVSQYVRRDLPLDWERSAAWTARLVRNLIDLYPEPGQIWNVNLPHLAPDSPAPEVVFCQLDPHPLPVDFKVEGNQFQYRGRYHDRVREAGRDVERCFAGCVTVTQLLLD